MPFENRFLHGPEGWRCQPFPVEVFPVWDFSGTGWRRWQLRGWAAAGTLRLTRQCFTYHFEVCLLRLEAPTSVKLLFGFCRSAVWLLDACVPLRVPGGGGVLPFCDGLFPLASRKKWNWYSRCFYFSARSLPVLRWLGLFASALHAQNEIRQVISVTNVRINPILPVLFWMQLLMESLTDLHNNRIT